MEGANGAAIAQRSAEVPAIALVRVITFSRELKLPAHLTQLHGKAPHRFQDRGLLQIAQNLLSVAHRVLGHQVGVEEARQVVLGPRRHHGLHDLIQPQVVKNSGGCGACAAAPSPRMLSKVGSHAVPLR